MIEFADFKFWTHRYLQFWISIWKSANRKIPLWHRFGASNRQCITVWRKRCNEFLCKNFIILCTFYWTTVNLLYWCWSNFFCTFYSYLFMRLWIVFFAYWIILRMNKFHQFCLNFPLSNFVAALFRTKLPINRTGTNARLSLMIIF